MAPGPSSDAAAVEETLRRLPEMELLGLLRRSSNYTFLASLRETAAAGTDGLLAVYKPAQGESPLWDFPEGSLYRREVAAYLLSRFLGWPRIPPTVVRERAPHGVGALQLFVDARPELDYLAAGDRPHEEWFEVALFDVIVNNADRKAGHCLVDQADDLWVIDHGLTFHAEPKLRTVIWDFAGRPAPAALRRDVGRAAHGLAGGELGLALRELLGRREVAELRRRVEAAAAPGWSMPGPGSAWSVPWPPV